MLHKINQIDGTQFQRILDTAGEIADGYTAFIAQGKLMFDATLYRCDDRDYYVLEVYPRKREFAHYDTFMNFTYINGRVREEFDEANVVRYESASRDDFWDFIAALTRAAMPI